MANREQLHNERRLFGGTGPLAERETVFPQRVLDDAECLRADAMQSGQFRNGDPREPLERCVAGLIEGARCRGSDLRERVE